MRYAIITNPAAGMMSLEEKRFRLSEAAEILGAGIHGLDAASPGELAECARDLARRFEVIVVAGGDGTLSEIINSVDLTQVTIAYLPLGTGNAIAHALGYRGSLARSAFSILKGGVHEYDLVDCDGRRRGFSMSVGIEGTIIRLRQRLLKQGIKGFRGYFRAFITACLREYRGSAARISIDHTTTLSVDYLLSLMVVKHPYYGFGMKVVPGARLDDRMLHVMIPRPGLLSTTLGILCAFTVGNRIGRHMECRHLSVSLDRPLSLQVDGDLAWESDSFTFSVLPKVLRLKGSRRTCELICPVAR